MSWTNVVCKVNGKESEGFMRDNEFVFPFSTKVKVGDKIESGSMSFTVSNVENLNNRSEQWLIQTEGKDGKSQKGSDKD